MVQTRSSKKQTGNGHIGVSTKQSQIADKTDRTRWRLLDESGRLTWHYLEDDKAVARWPQSVADKWYLGLDTVSATIRLPNQSIHHYGRSY